VTLFDLEEANPDDEEWYTDDESWDRETLKTPTPRRNLTPNGQMHELIPPTSPRCSGRHEKPNDDTEQPRDGSDPERPADAKWANEL
jgi:hypothetical protein